MHATLSVAHDGSHHSAAVGEAFQLGAHGLGLGQPEIGERSAVREVVMALRLNRSTTATGDNNREIAVLVGRSVTKAGAVGENGIVEQG